MNKKFFTGHTKIIRGSMLLFMAVIISFLVIVSEKNQDIRQHAAGNMIYANPGDNLPQKVSSLHPGDTLILNDGTFTNSQLLVQNIHGTQTAPITIEAAHDGAAIIDGNSNANYPAIIQVDNSSYITIKGLVARNSSGDVVGVYNPSTAITIQRITAYNAGTGNKHVVDVEAWGNGSPSNILLEDVAAWGNGRYIFSVYHANNVILRRCWAKWTSQSNFSPAPRAPYNVYGSSNVVLENDIGWNGIPVGQQTDIFAAMWETSDGPPTDNVSYYGNMFFNNWNGVVTNNSAGKNTTFTNNFFYNNRKQGTGTTGYEHGNGIQWWDPNPGIITNSTFVNNEVGYNKGASQQTLTNNVFVNNDTAIIGAPQESYSDFFANKNLGVTPGSTDTQVDPGYDTNTYGLGAYLFVPNTSPLKHKGANGADIGADILYEYQNGQLTTTPLWPWPMENRIKAETGMSVTWTSGGGFWNTLTNVYPTITTTQPPSSTGTPIPTPTGQPSVTSPCQTITPPTPTTQPSETPTNIPTITPTDTPFPTPTDLPSPTNTGTIPPTLTPSAGPPVGSLAVHFEGIDPQNNANPHHPQRSVILSFYTSQDFSQQPVAILSESVVFSSSDPNGSFRNTTIDLSTIPQGSYYVLVKSPEGSLQEILNNALPISIAQGQTTSFNGTASQPTNPIFLPMGDFNNDNTIDLTDYNILVDCFGTKATSSSCKAHQIGDHYVTNYADMNDDGTVNGIDYNILIRNFNQQGYGQTHTIPFVHFNTTPCSTPTGTPFPTPTLPQSTPTQTPTPTGGTQHLLYVLEDSSMTVYNMDNNFSQINILSYPAHGGIRGIAADPQAHMLYVSYGGDGGGNGNGSLLKYDLVANKPVWTKNYTHGIDSMAITPDGTKLYMPEGEIASGGKWYIIDATTGNETGSIDTSGGTNDNGPHNTIVSLNGQHVYMGDRNLAHNGSNYFYVASTTTNQIMQKVGPFQSGIRPFTINGKETLVFTSVTGFLGFQVADLTTGKVLYTVPIKKPTGASCNNSGATDPSHGVSLSPDEKELYVIDYTCNYVHVFNVSNAQTTVPQQIADIPVHPFNQNQANCAYDCLGDGWLLHSTDGKYVFVGDTGDVIDTTARKSIANLNALFNSRVYIEIDWKNGIPTSTTTRSGLGYVVQ